MQQYVWFYQLGKRYNSTKEPTSDTMSRYELCTIKEDCSLLNPQLLLATENIYYFPPSETDSETVSRKISDYTMVLFNNRYYRIDNIIYNSVEATVQLSVDVLATFKNSIKMSSQLVARSNNTGVFNTKIIDDNVVCNGEISVTENTSVDVFSPDESEGSIVIGTLNGSGSNYGNVTYYRLKSPSHLGDLQTELFSNVEWLNIADMSEEMTKALVNPLQYFVSCKHFPFIVSPEFDELEHMNHPRSRPIEFGYWASNVYAWRYLDNWASKDNEDDIQMIWERTVGIDVSKHPQTDSVGEFLNLAPYTTHTLDFEPFGQIAIDPLKLFECSTLLLNIKVDIITGAAILTLKGLKEVVTNSITGATQIEHRFISKHYANVATDHIISQATTDVLGVGTTAVNTAIETVGHIGGAIYSGVANFGADVASHVTSALTSAVSGASDIYRNSFPQCSKQGSMGNRFVDKCATLYSEFRHVTGSHGRYVGMPSCKQVIMWMEGNGFYKCINPQYSNDPSVGIVCTLEEQHRILRFMEEGFYLE